MPSSFLETPPSKQPERASELPPSHKASEHGWPCRLCLLCFLSPNSHLLFLGHLFSWLLTAAQACFLAPWAFLHSFSEIFHPCHTAACPPPLQKAWLSLLLSRVLFPVSPLQTPYPILPPLCFYERAPQPTHPFTRASLP